MHLVLLLAAITACPQAGPVIPEEPICTLSLRLPESHGEAEVRLVDRKPKGSGRLVQRVEVWLAGKPPRRRQVFPTGEHIGEGYFGYLFLADVNGDGADDIIMGIGFGTGGDSYDVLLYDHESRSFRRSASYSTEFEMIRRFELSDELHISAGYQTSCSEAFYRPLSRQPRLLRRLEAGKDDEDHARVRVLLLQPSGTYLEHEFRVLVLPDDEYGHRRPCEEPDGFFRRASPPAPGSSTP